MFRIIFTLLLLIPFIVLNADEGISFPLHKDSEYTANNSNFEPLSEEESFSLLYSPQKLTIRVIDKSGNQRIIGSWENCSWGGWNISENKRKLVFSLTHKGYYAPLYFVDGDAGSVQYLFNAPKNRITDKKLEYLIGLDHNSYLSQEFSPNKPFKYNLIIVDLRNTDMFKILPWELHYRLGSLSILRSKDPNYDFKLSYYLENILWAEAYYKANSHLIEVTMDNTGTDVSEIEQRSNYPFVRVSEELGFSMSDVLQEK